MLVRKLGSVLLGVFAAGIVWGGCNSPDHLAVGGGSAGDPGGGGGSATAGAPPGAPSEVIAEAKAAAARLPADYQLTIQDIELLKAEGITGSQADAAALAELSSK